MNLKQLRNGPATKRVMGLDISSKAVAFCLMVNDGGWRPLYWGKVDLNGADVWDQCGDVNRKVYGLMKIMNPDHVAVESVIYVNNREVVIHLAKVLGAVEGVVVATGRTCSEIRPTTWMSDVGTPTRDTDAVKEALVKEFPDKTKSWYKNELRKRRKQKTLDWVLETYDIELDDDDVGDAFGVAYSFIKED